MKRIRGLRGRRAAAAAVVALIAAGGAYAAIPSADGVINGCYRTSTDDQKGQLRVVEDPGSCRSNEQPIQWSQRGPAGPPGLPGEDGADGVSPTVAQLAAGDANCAHGGAAITDAAGTTAYVCSGAPGEDGEPFSGTFTSPNGQYSISVTNGGVTVASLDSSIEVTGSAIRVESTGADSIELRGGSLVRVESGAVLDLRSSAAASLTSVAGLSLRGGIVSVNGTGACQAAARVGDTVLGTGGGAAPVVASIVTGSPTVCVG